MEGDVSFLAENDRIRTDRYLLTLLPEESAMLQKNAFELGLSRADYLRKLIMYGNVVGRFFTMDKEQGKQLLYEINRIGNNINQIAYNTNAKMYAGNSDWQELRNNYFELLALLGKIPFMNEGVQEEWQQQISTLLHKQ